MTAHRVRVIRGRQFPTDVLEGKNNAYMRGAKTTACGFDLVEMNSFDDVMFVDHPPAGAVLDL